MKVRTQDDVNRQIAGLQSMKTWLPSVSKMGTPNHEKIDAQVSILKGDEDLTDFDEGDWDEMDETNEIYRAAEEAKMWLDGDMDGDLFEAND